MDFKCVSSITENHMHSHNILMTEEAPGDQEGQGDAAVLSTMTADGRK